MHTKRVVHLVFAFENIAAGWHVDTARTRIHVPGKNLNVRRL